ncbi:MAG: type III secretion system export apparatus subunit SctT [Pseudomonadota bacterium]
MSSEEIHWIFEHFKMFGFAVPRFLALFAILPLLSKEAMPMTLRMGMVSSFAAILVPGLMEQHRPEVGPLAILGLILKEVFIGATLGFILAVPLWAVEAMGDMADTQRGASIAQTLNPLTGHETSPLGQLFNQAIVTFLFVVGGFLAVLGVVYDSFALWPIFSFWPGFTPGAAEVMLSFVDRLMYLAVLMGVPVIFTMFIAEAGLAIVSRFAPQLQVFFLAMPVKSGIAMLVFAVYAVVLFDYAHDIIDENIRDAKRTLGSMLRKAG